MTPNPVQPIPGLYISDITVPRSAELMRQYGFTHVVSLTNARDRPRLEGVEQLWVDIEDDPFEDLIVCLEGVCTWIEDALASSSTVRTTRDDDDDEPSDHVDGTRGDNNIEDENVGETRSSTPPPPTTTPITTHPRPKLLLHCIQGISRSGAILVAYLMRTQHLPYDAALTLAQATRALVAPNSGFADQLRLWHQLRYSVHTWGEEDTLEPRLKDEYVKWKENRGVLLSRAQEERQREVRRRMEAVLVGSRVVRERGGGRG